jgi:hypothetical protein
MLENFRQRPVNATGEHSYFLSISPQQCLPVDLDIAIANTKSIPSKQHRVVGACLWIKGQPEAMLRTHNGSTWSNRAVL